MIALLWQRFYGYIIAIGGAILAVLAIFYRGKAAGRDAVERDILEKEADYAKETNRQDAIVLNGDAERMRTNLSEALRRKRHSPTP